MYVPPQMQQLESRHKAELSAHYRMQEKELEQLRSTYERELEKLRSKHRGEMDQRVGDGKGQKKGGGGGRGERFMGYILCVQVKQETSEERKFQKGVKERHDSDMKQFLAQQKADYKGTKAMYKRVCGVQYTKLMCM